jgi:hypothetical protein
MLLSYKGHGGPFSHGMESRALSASHVVVLYKGHGGPFSDGMESRALSESHVLSDKGHHSPSNDDKESEVFSRTLRMVRQGSKPPFPLVAGNHRMAKCY